MGVGGDAGPPADCGVFLMPRTEFSDCVTRMGPRFALFFCVLEANETVDKEETDEDEGAVRFGPMSDPPCPEDLIRFSSSLTVNWRSFELSSR